MCCLCVVVHAKKNPTHTYTENLLNRYCVNKPSDIVYS